MRYANDVLWLAQNDQSDERMIRIVGFDARTGAPLGDAIEIAKGKERPEAVRSMVYPHHVFFAVGEGSFWLTDFAALEVIRMPVPSAPVPVTPTNAKTASPTGSRAPSETGTGKHVFAKGSDPLAGSWSLFTEDTEFGPVFGVLIPGEQTFTTELKPLGDRTFGTWMLSGVSGNTLLLAQVVAPSVTRAEIRLDDGSMIDGGLVDLPSEIVGPARMFVAGFRSVMTAEGQHLDPNGYVVVYGKHDQELSRRRLAAG
jgi:hypothetical protein